MTEPLEKKADESLLGFEFMENGHKIRIIYQGNLELLRQGVYEIFIGLYDSLRRKK